MGTEENVALLRKFEPILRFTKGEVFFPADVGPYVRSCSMWVQRPDEQPCRLVCRGDMTLKQLSVPRLDEFGTVQFLKLTRPAAPPQMARQNLRRMREGNGFRAGRGRLARVGYSSRLVDALYNLFSLSRGRVPGDTAMAAGDIYRQATGAGQTSPTYFGRIVRQDNWLVLQYWFFYFFNDWRSGYSGANDHEADWEMISVFLAEAEEGSVRPEWVAFAMHDFSGDDLRRRWDDPVLEKVDGHPVVYVAAGSHASYFSAGEYLTELEIPFLAPLNRLTRRVQAFWWDTLRQYGDPDQTARRADSPGVFRIPFVDYARGDGASIGPGQASEWAHAISIEPPPDWVRFYRGLWGLFTNDPVGGENAPAGPMYERNGSVRRSWFDPVGWAGLDKVTPSSKVLAVLHERQNYLEKRRTELHEEMEAKSRELRGLGVEMDAMYDRPHLHQMHHERVRKTQVASKELRDLRKQLADDQAMAQSLKLFAGRIQAGELLPARSHIHHLVEPTTNSQLRFGRLAETWSAISVGALFIGSVLVVWLAQEYVMYWLLAGVAVLFFLEAAFRGNLTRLVTGITIALAVAAALILVYEFFWYLVALLVLITGAYILWDNLHELKT